MRLEESAAFTEHAVDNLTAQMLDLDARLHRAMARLDALESRLAQLDSPAPPDEPISS